MKALVYQNAHPIEQFAMAIAELPDPELRPTDILVEVKAIGINPGEAVFVGSHLGLRIWNFVAGKPLNLRIYTL